MIAIVCFLRLHRSFFHEPTHDSSSIYLRAQPVRSKLIPRHSLISCPPRKPTSLHLSLGVRLCHPPIICHAISSLPHTHGFVLPPSSHRNLSVSHCYRTMSLLLRPCHLALTLHTTNLLLPFPAFLPSRLHAATRGTALLPSDDCMFL